MIEIRFATSRDAESLASIGIRSWESAVTGWGENTETVQINARNAYREFCAEHWTRIVLAHEGGVMIGWGAREKLDNNITDLWIDPEHQGKGAGKALLARLEQEIVGAGFDSVVLETHAKNTAAIGFFEHLGYRVVSLSVGYSAGLGQDIQIVNMRRDFQAPTRQTRDKRMDDDMTKTIALVAHDARKDALVEWVGRHINRLDGVTIVATGTTGGRIRDSHGALAVTTVKSGPLGGDQQIGAMIADGKLDGLIFFVDPLSPMPHDVDIKALLRLAAVYDVPMAMSSTTADAVLDYLL